MESKAPKRRLLPAAPVIALAATVAAICAAWAVGAMQGGWVGPALRSRTSLIAGAFLLGSAIALYVVGGVLWRLGRQRGRRPCQEGSAAVEFALLLPLALMIVLIMLQATMVLTGNLIVHHAGFSAARAAIVWVPAALSYDEPRNVVAAGNSEKLYHIRAAAVYRLLAVAASRPGAGASPAAGDAAIIQDGFSRFFAHEGMGTPGWVQNLLEAKCDYAWAYTEVALHPPANGAQYGDHEDLSVWLKHTLYLAVPYANRVFAATGAGRSLGSGGDYGTDVEVTYTLVNQGTEDQIDIEQFPRLQGRGP